MTGANKSGTRAARWLLGLCAVVGSLLMAEAALAILGLPRQPAGFRFVRPDLELGDVFADFASTYVPDDDLFWKLDPERSGYLTNRLGLRGWLPEARKAPGVLRVACVGDSCTFGTGVRYEETWGVLLERLLQERVPARRVETILAALPGYSTQQSRVLYEEHIAALEPDVTIVYCGAWNDYAPAVGLSDSARHRQGRNAPPRLLRLLRGLSSRSGSEVSFLDALRRGEAPDGRRVPLDEFRANLDHLVGVARQHGSLAVLVIPPLPGTTVRRCPISLRYREVVRQVARVHDLLTVDGPELFAGSVDRGEVCYRDWVHPSPLGHRLIAERLSEVLMQQFRTFADADGHARDGPIVSSVLPLVVRALDPGRVVVGGSGFAAPGAFVRLRVGDRWIPEIRVVDDGRLTFCLSRPIAPGRHPLLLDTPRGLVESDVFLVVEPPEPIPLRAEIHPRPGGHVVELACRAPLGSVVVVWFSTALRTPPLSTRYGEFQLLGADPSSAGGAAGFRFEALELAHVVGHATRANEWRTEHDLGPSIRVDGDEVEQGLHVFAQGLVADRYDPSLAVLTSVVKLTTAH